MALKLRETVNEILEKKSWRQEDLANFLGFDPSTVSKMGTGAQWEAHWQAFVKLLPILLELDLLEERDLLSPTGHGKRSNTADHKAVKAAAGHGRKGGNV